jgi:hypothetical protein
MYKVELTCSFVTKSIEQAEHIRNFFNDAQALMTCESSGFSSTEITEFGLQRKPPVFDELLFASHGEASAVLEALKKVISNYGVATVSDMNELAGMPITYVDAKWGWRDLTNVEIKRFKDRDNWMMELPRPELIP